MENEINLPESGTPAPKFSAKPAEIAAALIAYVLGWFWIELINGETALWRVLFPALFIAIAEAVNFEKPRPRESFIWLGCFAAVWASLVFSRMNAFDGAAGIPLLMLHCCAVWYAMSRADILGERRTGRFMPVDALFGVFVYPLKNIFLRIRVLWSGVSGLFTGKKRDWETILWVIGAIAVSAVLFTGAVNMLSLADAGFGGLVSGITEALSFEVDEITWLRGFFAIFGGAYLFGVTAGTARERRETVDRRTAALDRFLVSLRKVPAAAWTTLVCVFAAVYALFFFLQGSYLFGAFTRTLPEGFIVSEYARQGFFELCRVSAINFALLWLVSRSGRVSPRLCRPMLIATVVLMAENALFAVVAASKLWLYIDCFGFTPLRWQSMWLVSVLLLSSACALVSVVTGKRTSRVAIVYASVTASLLCLI